MKDLGSTKKIIVLADSRMAREIVFDLLEYVGRPTNEILHGEGTPRPNGDGKAHAFPLDLIRRELAGLDLLLWLRGTPNISAAVVLSMSDFLLEGQNRSYCVQEI